MCRWVGADESRSERKPHRSPRYDRLLQRTGQWLVLRCYGLQVQSLQAREYARCPVAVLGPKLLQKSTRGGYTDATIYVESRQIAEREDAFLLDLGCPLKIQSLEVARRSRNEALDVAAAVLQEHWRVIQGENL